MPLPRSSRPRKRFVPRVLIFALILCTSCGYHFSKTCYKTISVPYVCEDRSGELTAALVRELSNTFCYRKDGGDLILHAKICSFHEDNVGYRYERKKDKNVRFTHTLIPTETRLSVFVEFSLEDATTGCLIVGPTRITSDVDYDHDYYFTRDGVNAFSLGQLTDIDEAHDAALLPLYQDLAKKIGDYIANAL